MMGSRSSTTLCKPPRSFSAWTRTSSAAASRTSAWPCRAGLPSMRLPAAARSFAMPCRASSRPSTSGCSTVPCNESTTASETSAPRVPLKRPTITSASWISTDLKTWLETPSNNCASISPTSGCSSTLSRTCFERSRSCTTERVYPGRASHCPTRSLSSKPSGRPSKHWTSTVKILHAALAMRPTRPSARRSWRKPQKIPFARKS
mmetsp:Transcript_16999/g.36626  ORF Transcript_16999/g.36626 Transcript_16999/m.36626 type:complete len:205 (-) Transcript_16999:2298-2912(-)